MTLLGKVVRRKPAELFLTAEALMLLAIFRVCLAVVPVRRIIGAITHGQRAQTSDDAEVAESSASAARRVEWAVSAAARHSIVEFVCFPQALAGYTMLRWRGMPSTIVYGVARSPEGELRAHAWLTVGDRMVLGGEAASEFTALERWS
jgi:hypothetical protein